MGDFNRHAPAQLGSEFRPTAVQEIELTPGQGLAMRVVPGSGVTWDQLVAFFSLVIGTPGLALEILSSLDTVTSVLGTKNSAARYFPGSDTDAVFAGFANQSGTATATAVRQAVDDFQVRSDYARNVAAMNPSTKLKMLYRGAGSAHSGKRMNGLHVGIDALVVPGSGTEARGPHVRGLLNIGGTDYPAPERNIRIPAKNNWITKVVGYYPMNPATQAPWLMSEADSFISSPTNEFGFQADGASVAATSLRIASLLLEEFFCTENRLAAFYDPTSPQRGWVPGALLDANGGAADTESANTAYYVHVYALPGGKFVVPCVWDPRADFVVEDDPTLVGEHRVAYLTQLSDAGVVIGYQRLDGRMIPALLSAAGTFHGQSQPYAGIVYDAHDADTAANVGQQITSGTDTVEYPTARIAVGWATATPPNADLVAQVRSTTVGGTLLGTARLRAVDTSQEVLDRVLQFDAGFNPPNATLLFFLIDTTAAAAAGWLVPRADTRSDLLNGSLTAANVEGCTQGGQTDSYFTGGTPDDRYDILVALSGAPGQVVTPDDPTPDPQPTQPVAEAVIEQAI